MSRRGLLRRLAAIVAQRTWADDDPAWEEWSAVLERHHAALAAAGPAVLHDLLVDAAAPAPFDPATWSDNRRELVVCCAPIARTGYGEVSRALLRALPAAGVTPVLAPTRAQLDAELEPLARELGHWVHGRPGALPAARRAVYTMWESTRVPAWRIDELNAFADVVFVPCAQNARAFADCGLGRPVRVLHHGVDPQRFPAMERPSDRPLTFGTFGDLSPRKGVDVLVRAFREEFGPRDDVALLLRSSTRRPELEALAGPRIRVVHGAGDQAALLATLQDMDAFVLPSRGEGFGLCGLEAAATGLPIVATDWGGPQEYVRDVHGLPLRYALRDAGGQRIGDSVFEGQWAEPDVTHLRALLRELAVDRDAARDRGRAAAVAVRDRWTWRRAAVQLRAELDERTEVA
jgi:glycosyltransferase involved in cell wall biosynthesis